MLRIRKSWLLVSLTLAMCAFAGPLAAQERALSSPIWYTP